MGVETDWAQVRAEYDRDRLSVNALAKKHRRSYQTVRSHLLKLGPLRPHAEQNRIAGVRKRKEVSESRWEWARRQHEAGMAQDRIAAELGVSLARMREEFTKRGWSVEPVAAFRFTLARARVLRRDYEKLRMSLPQLAAREGASKEAVRKAILRAGGRIRTAREASRKYDVLTTAFDAITPQSAYWIGMLMADGNVLRYEGERARSAPRVKLTASRVDRGHLERLQRFWRGNPISDGTARVRGVRCLTSECYVYSHEIAEALRKWGVVPRKSKIARAHDSLLTNRHFWRGVVDGDGCLHIRLADDLPMLTIAGSRALMRQFADFCQREVGVVAKVRRHRKQDVYLVSVSGQNAVPIIRLLYPPRLLALPRKRDKAREILRRYGRKTDWRPGRKQADRDAEYLTRVDDVYLFVQQLGHARVPQSYVTPWGVGLGRWVARQREAYRRGLERLTPQRIAWLEGVPGWKWSIAD